MIESGWMTAATQRRGFLAGLSFVRQPGNAAANAASRCLEGRSNQSIVPAFLCFMEFTRANQ